MTSILLTRVSTVAVAGGITVPLPSGVSADWVRTCRWRVGKGTLNSGLIFVYETRDRITSPLRTSCNCEIKQTSKQSLRFSCLNTLSDTFITRVPSTLTSSSFCGLLFYLILHTTPKSTTQVLRYGNTCQTIGTKNEEKEKREWKGKIEGGKRGRE